MFTKLALATALMLGFAGTAIADVVKWTANLDPKQEGDNKVASPNGKGMATGTLDTASGSMTYDLEWSGLTANATMMHFHGPAPIGKNAGPVVDIGKASGVTSPSKGMAMLTPDQVKQLMGGMWYINIHTSANPAGEIRGQVNIAK